MEPEEATESHDMISCHVITTQGVYTFPPSTQSTPPVSDSVPDDSVPSREIPSESLQVPSPSVIPESALEQTPGPSDIPESAPEDSLLSPLALVSGEANTTVDDPTVNPSHDLLSLFSPGSGEVSNAGDDPTVCPSNEGNSVDTSASVADSPDSLLSQDLGTPEVSFLQEEADGGGQWGYLLTPCLPLPMPQLFHRLILVDETTNAPFQSRIVQQPSIGCQAKLILLFLSKCFRCSVLFYNVAGCLLQC